MSNSSKRKRILAWVFSLIFVVTIASVGGFTFARYLSGFSSGSGSKPVAKWAIKIGSTQLTSTNTTVTTTFTQMGNDKIVNGKIAPGSVLYADFLIDPTGTEVAVDYWFSLAVTATSGTVPTGFTITSVKTIDLSSSEEIASLTEDATGETKLYKGQIALPTSGAMTTNERVKVRVTATWAGTGNDANDTSVGGAATTPSLTLTVNGTFQQCLGTADSH